MAAMKRQERMRQKKPSVRNFKKKGGGKKSGRGGASKKQLKRPIAAKKTNSGASVSKPAFKGNKELLEAGAVVSSKKIISVETGSGPAKKTTRTSTKRVSFATKLVKKKSGKLTSQDDSQIITNGVDNGDSGSPLKPILKRVRRNSTSADGDSVTSGVGKSKKGKSSDSNRDGENSTKESIEIEGEKETKDDDPQEQQEERIRVSKSVKEQLETMTKKEKREFLRQLKAKKKPFFELAMKAKKLWEKIRSKRQKGGDDRERLIDQLYSLVEGKVKQLIYAHDTVRVVQCLMALKRHAELRTKLFEEVRDEILQMAKSKYAKFFVIKMLKYGTPAQREYVIEQFYGKIPSLLKHAVASEVVEYAYNEYANALQRSRMVSEFYSPEFALWKVDEALSLKQILEKQPARKPAVLQSMKEHVLDLATKPVLRHTLVHRLIREFFGHCDASERKDVVDSLKERVIEMIHTKDGVICAMNCVWYGTKKDRKTIVQTFKSLVTKTCCEEHGHLVLLAIFDAVTDTAAVKTTILKEIKQNLEQLIKNKHAMKVLHYLLKPRSGIHFSKPIVSLLAEGDSTLSSKEEMAGRHMELLEFISPSLLTYCTENMEELVMDSHACLLVLSILENAIGDKSDAYRSLCNDVLTEEFVPMNIEHLHAIECAHSHFMLKKLIQNDKRVSETGEKTFSETLASELSDGHFLSWMSCNKGAFILIYMYETGITSVQERIISIVESPSGRKKIKQYTFPAAKILAKKCAETRSSLER